MKKMNKRFAGIIIAGVGIYEAAVGFLDAILSSALLGIALFLIGYVFIQEKPEKKD